MRSRLDVRGGAIEAASWSGDQPALVLLHEGLGSVALWRDFPEALAARTRRAVLAYSRPGHGSSDPPAAPHTTRFMHEEALDGLPAVLDTAGIDRAVLVGHSDGGSIAIVFAASCPQRVDALILEAPHVFVEDVSVESITRMQTLYETTTLRTRLAKYHDDVDAAFHGWCDVWLDPAFRSWNLEEYLPAITCPVLVIQGRDDEYGTLRQVDAIARQVTGHVDTLVLDHCGHSPHRDQPEQVLTAIEQFVSHR